MKSVIFSSLVTLHASVAISFAATLSYDWTPAGDQGLLGWTNVRVDSTTYSPTTYAFFDNGGQLGSFQGTVAGIPGGAAQDTSHTPIVAQSPLFTLTATSNIAFSLSQGMATSTLVADFASLPASSSAPGYVGLALMRASDGAYLLNRSKTANSGNESLSFSALDISTATAGDLATEQYTLQLIDYKQGNWGHVGLRTATLNDVEAVPEPASLALLLLGTGGLAMRRRR